MQQDVPDYQLIERMTDYLAANHIDTVMMAAIDCPYQFENKDSDYLVSMIWATYTATLPGRKVRLVDDYAKKHVRDPVFAAKIRRATSVTMDVFVIVERSNNGNFVIRSKKDGTTYKAMSGPRVAEMLAHRDEAKCVIHPWAEDGTYNIAAVVHEPVIYYKSKPVTVNEFVEEIQTKWKKEAESVKLTPRTRLKSVLAEMPGDWVEPMCTRLRIKPDDSHSKNIQKIMDVLTSSRINKIVFELPESAFLCLEYLVAQGGYEKMLRMEKKFGKDDTTHDWNKDAESPIGMLRRTGMVVVGRKRIQSRNSKVAFVTYDIIDNVESAIRARRCK